MENLRKRSVINLVIWVFASVDLYALSYIGHLPIARLAAFIALLVSAIIAGILYLIQSGWKP